MINLVIYGPPGSGKGTHAKLIAERYNLFHISLGEFLRKEKANKTYIGITVKPFIDSGELIPDQIILNLLRKLLFLKENKIGVVIDGFPRTVEQAKALSNILEEAGHPVTLLLDLDVNKTEYLKRIRSRANKKNRADDQHNEIIEQRIELFNKNCRGVIRFYKRRNKYKRIFAHKDKEFTHMQICQCVDPLLKL